MKKLLVIFISVFCCGLHLSAMGETEIEKAVFDAKYDKVKSLIERNPRLADSKRENPNYPQSMLQYNNFFLGQNCQSDESQNTNKIEPRIQISELLINNVTDVNTVITSCPNTTTKTCTYLDQAIYYKSLGGKCANAFTQIIDFLQAKHAKTYAELYPRPSYSTSSSLSSTTAIRPTEITSDNQEQKKQEVKKEVPAETQQNQDDNTPPANNVHNGNDVVSTSGGNAPEATPSPAPKAEETNTTTTPASESSRVSNPVATWQDTRRYVSDAEWAKPPYNKFVRLNIKIDDTKLDVCTAQYIAPNIILSAGHCVRDGALYSVDRADVQDIPVKLIGFKSPQDSKDWSLFLIENSEYYRNDVFNVAVPDYTNQDVSVMNVGWGGMKILTPNELQQIRNNPTSWAEMNYQDEENKMKVDKCRILSKRNRDIDVVNKYKLDDNWLVTDCVVVHGNSGGGIVSNNGNLYGVVSLLGAKGVNNWLVEHSAVNIAASSKQFIDVIKAGDFADDTSNVTTSSSQVAAAERIMNEIKQEAQTVCGEVEKNSTSIKQMSDYELAMYLDKVVYCKNRENILKKLQQAYDDAKENEQSLANRTLTALTVAATGIGGMELARGLSEQKADEAAAADMAAYIATMRCEYANGKSVKAGPEEIELPGGNNQNLMNYRAEYIALAKDLKERKAALGMKAGIESEEILDKTNLGLYDDENIGITSGAEASLYRAQMLNSETDQAKLDDMASTSSKRVKGGAIAAGVGVVGGVVGNILLNGGDKKDTTDEQYDADGDAVYSDTGVDMQRMSEERNLLPDDIEQYASLEVANKSMPVEKTYGCSGGRDIAATIARCEKTQTSEKELARCKKCVNNAGTYENGKCYVEVIGWACLAKGWNPKSKQNPAQCSENNKYQDCHIVRKYIDVEQKFVCDPASYMPGQKAVLSGCGQHGWSAGDKHPPMSVSNDNKQADCSLPLSSNNSWRSAYKKGTAIGITYGKTSVVTANWCMPNANSSPWNSNNHTGAAKHLLSSSLMAGGESKSQWFSLD